MTLLLCHTEHILSFSKSRVFPIAGIRVKNDDLRSYVLDQQVYVDV